MIIARIADSSFSISLFRWAQLSTFFDFNKISSFHLKVFSLSGLASLADELMTAYWADLLEVWQAGKAIRADFDRCSAFFFWRCFKRPVSYRLWQAV